MKTETTECDTCGKPLVLSERKYPRCNACRIRKCRGSLIDGEQCAVPGCAIDLARVLRWHRFSEKTVALCANHDALAGRKPSSWRTFLAEATALEQELTPLPARVEMRPLASTRPEAPARLALVR